MNNAKLLELLQKYCLSKRIRLHNSIPEHKTGELLFSSDCYHIVLTSLENLPVGVDHPCILIIELKNPGVVVEVNLSHLEVDLDVREFETDLSMLL